MHRSTVGTPIPEPSELSRDVAQQFSTYVAPLLTALTLRLDVRLVRTFAATLVNLVCHRNRVLSLLLTELGEQLLDGAHAPAGVKRLWRLLHSASWDATLLDTWMLEQADQAVTTAQRRDGVAYAVLDGSVLEKPAARTMAGLTTVRSAVGRRLQRAIGGPPGRPILVPGFPWVSVIITGAHGSLTLARLHWFSPKAPAGLAQTQREAERAVVAPLLARWGTQVLWLVDRGFGNHTFLGTVLTAPTRFIARWRKDYTLMDPLGTLAPASQLTRTLRSRWRRRIFDPTRQEAVTVGIASLPVYLPGTQRLLWLVVARRVGKKESLWLLTTEAADTELGACAVVLGYARRWQVEWAYRFQKSELGLGSIRLASWTYRAKLWSMAALVHAFLLHLLVLADGALVAPILRWCHRTGCRARQAVAPLYRLRHGLANLWLLYHPTLSWSA